MNYQAQQKRYIALIDEQLTAYMHAPGLPELLQKSMSYSLLATGKRLRPCMTLASCKLLGGDIMQALPFACAIEMIHTYSLIHDDLPAMDDDDFRRGNPSNHKVFGEGQAILAGDGLLSYAFAVMLEYIDQYVDRRFINAANAIARGAGVFGMVAGQCMDMEQEGKGRPDKATLLKIHEGKTASMLLASAEAGAYCAGAGNAALQAIRKFGRAYGLLFQITDDILDIEGESRTAGKTLGKDVKAQKVTFPAVYGLEKSKAIAAATARQAKDALSIFGDQAWYLKEMLSFTVSRNK
ncbi:MAG: polyprenyl synthetase family protein [Clostridiales bacterium]|jgi:geranylgeranyl diphosphate synthase type II|nr:polyprenyl synthetase family protein [Clostridiales bacterium]